jgi:hypothetical protein
VGRVLRARRRVLTSGHWVVHTRARKKTTSPAFDSQATLIFSAPQIGYDGGMKADQFSLRQLLLSIAFLCVGLGCAAYGDPYTFWGCLAKFPGTGAALGRPSVCFLDTIMKLHLRELSPASCLRSCIDDRSPFQKSHH